MSDYETRDKTAQETDIIKLLQELRVNPSGPTDIFGKLIKLANQYILVDPTVVEPEDARFRPHQFCSKCQTDRKTSDRDAQREIRLRYRLQVCMLRTLSFKVNKSITKWLQGLFSAIVGCIDCYKGFLKAKEEIGPEFLYTVERERIENFLLFSEEWEESKALELIHQRDIGDKGKWRLSISELYAMLTLAGSLASRGKKKGIYDTLKSKRKQLRVEDLPEAPTGLLALAIDDDIEVRTWVEMQRGISPISDALSSSKTVRRLFDQAMEKDDWDGVAVMLKLAPSILKGKDLLNMLLAQLSEDDNKGATSFRFFSGVLEEKGVAFWEAEDAEYPIVVLTTILDSGAYRNNLMRADFNVNYLDWMKPFLTTLVAFRSVTSQSHNESEEESSKSKVFDDALKRIIYFLIETMQQGSIQLNSRNRFVIEAVKLLRFSLILEGDYEAEDIVKCAKSSAATVTLHSSIFTSYALHGRLPKTGDKIGTNMESCKAAFELIQEIFEMDCNTLTDSFLMLSNVTTEHQARYKKIKKQMIKKVDKGEILKTAEKLFVDAVKDLKVTPMVSSELWKEAYNTFRPQSDDVGIFLKPLARLSTLTAPQISSYVISVKEEHESLASYHAYVDRLKGCLATFKGRLRSVRYNLPRVLLDICDERGVSSRGSQPLSLICYKMAYAVIQANLCPEQEVHKAAQNLVRNTFDEAETREDCFRALLQSNPALSLTGIHDYLESFLIAASNLVEANEAAKWMVRSFSDVVNVLCSQTDGLLRQGTLHSLVDKEDVRNSLGQLLPSIWQLMCRSIAVIFKRTPNWSYILPHSELTAWFRDVLLFASDLVDQVEVVQDAIRRDRSSSDDDIENILVNLAIPLEEAVSWFRMNDMGIVQETRDYFIKGLRAFKGEIKLPILVKERMLAFIDAQSKIEDSQSRMTLLTLKDLSELRHLLESRDIIEIEDSEEDQDGDLEEVNTPPPPPREVTRKDDGKTTKSAVSEDSTSIKTPSLPKASIHSTLQLARAEEEQRKLKQQKLAFAKLDASVSRPFLSKPARLPPQPPLPLFASTHRPANKYQSTATRSSKPSSAAFAEARRSFNATSTWKAIPRGFNGRMGHLGRDRELADPQAPAAKRTFTGATMDPTINQSRESNGVAEQGGSESGESESEEEKQTLGLADLIERNKSPVKMRPKIRVSVKPPPRRTVMVEDAEARRRQREAEEAERKRKLRERANFNPLHRIILSWDFFAESTRPPIRENEEQLQYEKVKVIYKNPQEYTDLFHPMIILEAWAQFVSARDMMARGAMEHAPSPITIAGRSVVDSFVLLTVTLHVQPNRQKDYYNEADVVYIRESSVLNQRARSILAKVDAYKGDPTRKLDRLTLRCSLQGDVQGMTSLLVAGTNLEMGKLFTLITIQREYEALEVVPYFDLIPSILQAKSSIKEVLSEVDIRQAQSDYGVNRPQAEAILGSLKAEQGFNLIQGPPGTGKTKTICSLVAHFIQTRQDAAVPIRAGQMVNASTVIKKKILLCAPSNAAVDEVAKRVQEGVRLKSGKMIKPIVVRLGRDTVMNVSVKNISLDAIVERRLASTGSSSSQAGDGEDDATKMQAEIRRLKDERDAKRAELENARLTNMNEKLMAQLDVEIRHLSVKRMDLMSKLDEAKDQRQTANRQQNADRRRIEQEILAGSDVVCTTLGGAGHNMLFDLPFDFETVIIDEAAQAVELDTLIPLRYGCQRCILVGDPNQLPPTVISQEADKLLYSRSLFVRLFHNPKNYTNLLSIQYRMHPSISRFPSVEFYGGQLEDGEGMATLTSKIWHKDPLLAPFRFFNCKNSREVNGKGTSLINREEAVMCAAIYERLRKEALRLGNESVEGKVGVISMYKEQIYELKRSFEAIYGRGIENVVDFNTVDGFQGQEKDTIILSCVRTQGIGFLKDFRRVNVAITRAKSNLFIVGHAENLESNGGESIWPKMIELARKENCFMTVTIDAFKRPAFVNSIKPIPTGPAADQDTSMESAVKKNKKKKKKKKDGQKDGQLGETASSLSSPVKLATSSSKSPMKRKADTSSDSIQGPSSKRLVPDNGKHTSTANATNQPSSRPVLPQSHNDKIVSTKPSVPSLPKGVPLGPPPAPPPQRPRARPPLNSNSASLARPINRSNGSGTNNGIPILPPAPVANAPRPPPRPAQLYRPPIFSSQEGPSDKAKSSLFMQKSARLARPKKK